MIKYVLTSDFIIVGDKKLHRIRAVRSFGNVQKGELGGYIESPKNLRHTGLSWIGGNALVYDDSIVYDDAVVCGDAVVRDRSEVYDKAIIEDNCIVEEA